jgi:hypothetical protein
MYKYSFILCLVLLIGVKLQAQQRSDTIKCYVQIMLPAEGTIGMSRNIEDNTLFINGGMFIYTKAYAIKDAAGKYVKFLTPRKKELKDIWWPDAGPVVMKKDW